MAIHHGEKFVILDDAKATINVRFAQEAKVGHELPEPDVGGKRSEFGQQGNGLSLLFVHGSTSPILGCPANGLAIVPMTSTRINVPGVSFAILVARATPLYSIKTPSDPS